MLKKIQYKIIFILLGISASIWFLIRVIPKPSRASYPCMKAAAPFMSSFIIYLLSISGTALLFKKFKLKSSTARFLPALGFFVAFIVMLMLSDVAREQKANALNLVNANSFEANVPIGMAKGYMPGRVSWVWDRNATDENFTASDNINNWWINSTNGDVVEAMLKDAITGYAGKNNLADAWDVLFKHFNKNHDKGLVGYTSGEKIYIKVNLTNSSMEGTKLNKTKNFDRMDSTPEVMLALLKQLIEELGVAQEDIYLGDPFRTFRDEYWEICHSIYPNVVYCDGLGKNGRHQTVATDDVKIIFSDKKFAYQLPQEYYEADYFINLPALKSHDSAGITIGVKNHQGSILKPGDGSENQSAYAMHYAFPDHDHTDGGPHRYRHLVDYAGHERLGGNTLLTIVDGIWAGRRWEGFVEKWQMPPFNGDYPNSIFVSQDLLAIDAVCFDFLLEEYKFKDEDEKYPYMSGTDDYLMQSADPANWAEGISYDPENDGIPLKSLGVYEHWDNAISKKYSRNLGTGNGIELVSIFKSVEIEKQLSTENSDLPSNEVKSIFIDSSMVAWIGTDAGLARFDGISWNIYSTENYLLHNQVNDLAFENVAEGNELWIGTNGGVTVASFDTDGLTEATTYTPENSELHGSQVNNVMVDLNHNRWITTETAINVFKGSTWDKQTSAVDADGNVFNFSEYNITDMDEFQPDTLAFVSTYGKGVVRIGYNEVDGFTGASTYGQPWAATTSNHFTAVSIKGEEQWYGTNTGVNYHPKEATKSDWYYYTEEENNIFSNTITAIHMDNNGNIWVGSAEGLNIIKADAGISKYSEYFGLINNHINVITSDPEGNVWVGTSGGVEWFESVPGVDVSTSNQLQTIANRVKAYPNPSSDFIKLEINLDRPQFVRVSIYNTKGQLIDVPIEQKIRDSNSLHQIDINNKINYKQGIYIVRIECEDYTELLKFHKN